MKSLMICLIAFGSLAALPQVSSARDRSADAAAVADSLGLETGSYRMLSATEADQVRWHRRRLAAYSAEYQSHRGR